MIEIAGASLSYGLCTEWIQYCDLGVKASVTLWQHDLHFKPVANND